MRVRLTSLALLGAALLLGACEQEKKPTKKKIVLGRKRSECQLTLDGLFEPESQWVILRINPDKTETPDPRARLKLYKDGDTLKAKYTVDSFSDVYTYTCKKTQHAGREELVCKEEPKTKDWCQALMVVDKPCTFEALKQIDPDVTQAEFEEGLKKAEEIVKKYKGTDKWKQFVFNNNNLGNKLQGIAYISIDKNFCRLRMTDHYMTIYNGKRVEDSNPVGTNPFVRWDPEKDGELMWEHCTDSVDFVALKTPEFPKNEQELYANLCVPNHQCYFGIGEPVYFQYVGQDARKPEEGCTYSFDIWTDWRPLKKNVPAEIVDVKGHKELRWHYTHSFDKEGPHVTEMVRYKSCNGGPKEQVEVSCNLIAVQ